MSQKFTPTADRSIIINWFPEHLVKIAVYPLAKPNFEVSRKKLVYIISIIFFPTHNSLSIGGSNA